MEHGTRKTRIWKTGSAATVFTMAVFIWIFFSFGPDARTFCEEKPETLKTVKAETKTIMEWYEAVGTVRPRTEAKIEPQVMAQILDVKVRPGDKVEKGTILAVLDNRTFKSRLDQAKQAMKSAVAGKRQAEQSILAARADFKQAESNYKRIQKYFKSQAATSQQLEVAESAYKQARANLSRVREALSGSEAMIRQAEERVREAAIFANEYTKIKAPDSGEVLKRLAEPGDMAVPGKPLLVLRTTGSLRLEAYVREGLIPKVKSGNTLKVRLDTLSKEVDAVVDEIVPYADPQTRTFLVKATLPSVEGLFPGMFGKLLIPVEEHPVVLIPKKAVRKIGQLEMVDVNENGKWVSRLIKSGNPVGEKIEVLSGLFGNEIIGVKE